MLGIGESPDQPVTPKRTVTYGRGLWDCVHVLEQNTLQKSQAMKAVRQYMANFKTSLNMFEHNLS